MNSNAEMPTALFGKDLVPKTIDAKAISQALHEVQLYLDEEGVYSGEVDATIALADNDRDHTLDHITTAIKQHLRQVSTDPMEDLARFRAIELDELKMRHDALTSLPLKWRERLNLLSGCLLDLYEEQTELEGFFRRYDGIVRHREFVRLYAEDGFRDHVLSSIERRNRLQFGALDSILFDAIDFDDLVSRYKANNAVRVSGTLYGTRCILA